MPTCLRSLALAALVVAACARQPAAPVQAGATPPAAITWQAWGAGAFQQAARESKLVVVDVGIEGCTACRYMHDETYADPAVRRWLAAHAVTVSVDADMQPDVAERFDPWGWPATGILTPDGRTLWMVRGHKPADILLSIFEEVLADHRAKKPIEPVEDAPRDPQSNLVAACLETVKWIDERGGETGWGSELRLPNETLVRFSLARAAAFGETGRLARVRAHARGTTQLLDPEWGGVFVASRTPDWRTIIPEKRTHLQAQALGSFGLTYGIDGDRSLLAAAAEIDRYLRSTMLSADGTYFTTQRDEIPNLPGDMTAVDYYALKDAERRRYGVPALDHGVYTAENAQLALAYLELWRSSRDARWLERARELMDAVLASGLTSSGFLRQGVITKEIDRDRRLRAVTKDARSLLYLKPQVQVGFVLIELAEATQDLAYLDSAERLARSIEPLRHPDGGYHAGAVRETDTFLARRTPAYENVWAARLLSALHAARGTSEFRDAAARVLKTIRGVEAARRSEGLDGAAVYALALQEHLLGPIRVRVAGPEKDPDAEELLRVALKEPDSRVFARREAGTKASAAVCGALGCTDHASPEELARALQAALHAGPGAPCAAAP